jgi:hypothetical protein
VTLIVEARGQRDFAEWSIRFGYLMTGEFDANAPDEISYCATEVFPELAS